MRALILAAFAVLTLMAPASAQETTQDDCPPGYVASPEGCSEQAWVDDCPPDMMCAAGASDDNMTYGCDEAHCSGMADGNGTSAPVFTTCMDGADEGEDCEDDIVYFGPGPADTGGAPADGAADGEERDGDGVDQRDAAGVTLFVVSMALVAAVIAYTRR